MGLQYLIEMKEIFKKYKLIPLATLKSKEEVKNISRLLLDNNIPIFELTLRDSAVYDIADEFQNFPEINLGIGTIKTRSDIDFAKSIGAKFGISPGFNHELSEYAH